MSLFYRVSAQTTGLLVGMNLLAYLAVGPTIRGVIVPTSAVVWWQGKAWVYLQRGQDRFARREVPAESPLQDGWFVVNGFSGGDHVVVKGAQLLLSEEFRGQIQTQGEEGSEE